MSSIEMPTGQLNTPGRFVSQRRYFSGTITWLIELYLFNTLRTES